MFIFKNMGDNERALVLTTVSPVSICHQFSDELNTGNSERILIFPWTWEEMLEETPLGLDVLKPK